MPPPGLATWTATVPKRPGAPMKVLVKGKQKVMQTGEFEELQLKIKKMHDMIAFFLHLNDGSIACEQKTLATACALVQTR